MKKILFSIAALLVPGVYLVAAAGAFVDLKVNGLDSPVVQVDKGQPVSLQLSASAQQYAGVQVDWWVTAYVISGDSETVYSYRNGRWVKGWVPTLQSALRDLNGFQVKLGSLPVC